MYILALCLVVALCHVHDKSFHRHLNGLNSLMRHMDTLREEFPEFDSSEIEGWDQMTQDEKDEVTEFYDIMKEMFEAFQEFGDEIENMDPNDPAWEAMERRHLAPPRRKLVSAEKIATASAPMRRQINTIAPPRLHTGQWI